MSPSPAFRPLGAGASRDLWVGLASALLLHVVLIFPARWLESLEWRVPGRLPASPTPRRLLQVPRLEVRIPGVLEGADRARDPVADRSAGRSVPLRGSTAPAVDAAESLRLSLGGSAEGTGEFGAGTGSEESGAGVSGGARPPAPFRREAEPTFVVPATPARGARSKEGAVSVRVWIDSTGAVTRAEALDDSAGERPDRRLVQAAVEAARRWRFRPARESGRAIASTLVLPFRFDRE